MSLIGIDVGTGGCKAAAYTVEGRLLGRAYREYAPYQPRPGWVELDSRRVIEVVFQTLAEVASLARSDPVTALAVSSMGEAVTPVSLDRQILGNSILMSDPRGGEYVRRLAEEIGQEAFYRINPNILGVNYSLPKLLWLRDHQRELYERADRFLLWGDLVAFLLGCEPTTSFSLANRTLLFDLHREDWSEELLRWAGIDRGKLPRAVASGTVAGTVSDSVAERLGLPKGVAVVVGGHDQSLNSLGAGACAPGKAVCGIGTVQCITPTYDRVPPEGATLAAGLNVEHHVLPGRFVSFFYNQAGGLVRWFRDTFASADRRLPGGSAGLYDALTAEMPPEPTRLLVLPYFDITGSPRFISDAAGAVLGLKTHTTRGEILKAILEGATFYFVEGLRALRDMGIDTSEFVATGGGAKSDAWLQIQADIFGVPFVRPRETECGVAGAAMLAGLGTGLYAGPEEAIAQFVRKDRVFEPDARRHEIYRQRYPLYEQLYPALRELLRRV